MKASATLKNEANARDAIRENGVPRKSGKEKGPEPEFGAFDFIPAATYVPTQLPVQYHRPGEA
jgi:hypothetical protein